MNTPMQEIRTTPERSIVAFAHAEGTEFELVETCKRGNMTFTHITQLSLREAQKLRDFLTVHLDQHIKRRP